MWRHLNEEREEESCRHTQVKKNPGRGRGGQLERQPGSQMDSAYMRNLNELDFGSS